MATLYSPRVVTDGLVLCLDVANGKSFRGEPTVNVVANSQPTNSWGVANFGGSTATVSYLTENGIPFLRYTSVTSISGYPRFTDSVFSNSATISGGFSTSFEARGTSNAQLWLRIYENGSTKITNIATLTSDWVRYTFENQTTSFNLNQPYFHPFTTGATYDIRNIQIEAKPYATPFVSGSRGTTVQTGGGWLDISRSGNNGELVNNPIYSSGSGGSLVFDGVDEYIDTNVNLSQIVGANPTAITFEFVAKAYDLTNPIGICGDYVGPAGTGFGIKRSSGSNRLEFRVYATGGIPSSTSDIPINKWFHGVCVWDGTTTGQHRIYFNGNLETTDNTPGTTWNHGGGTLRIGDIYGGMGVPGEWNGEIAVFKIYNRALTSTEIQTNYNALKRRFEL